MADPNARDLKLIQWLNEAYGTEKQLETALEAHIAMTTRAPYRKRLQEHLRETKRHGTAVSRRIKQLGGQADATPVPVPEAASGAAQAVTTAVSKAVALAQGPVHALRGTGEAEKQLRNARTEYASEAEEIATYSAIVQLAESVGDKETAKLARGILREEQRMAKFLERQIPTLMKSVVTAEIPAAERNGGRRRTSRRRASSSRSSASSRSSSSRSSSSRRTSGSRSGSRSGGSRSGASRSGGSRSGASRSGGSRSSGGSSARSRSGARSGRRTSSRSSGGSSRSGRSRGGSRS
jgi:ferritin-like metal-binding protein YciE